MGERPPEDAQTAAHRRPEQKTVRVVSVRQEDMESGNALSAKAARKILCRRLTTPISIGVEGKIDSPGPVAQLLKLPCVGMIAQ